MLHYLCNVTYPTLQYHTFNISYQIHCFSFPNRLQFPQNAMARHTSPPLPTLCYTVSLILKIFLSTTQKWSSATWRHGGRPFLPNSQFKTWQRRNPVLPIPYGPYPIDTYYPFNCNGPLHNLLIPKLITALHACTFEIEEKCPNTFQSYIAISRDCPQHIPLGRRGM